MELLCTVTVFVSTPSGCLSCIIHVVYPTELRVIYNFAVTGMFCVSVNDIPSCLVNVHGTRTPSKTLQFVGNNTIFSVCYMFQP